MKPFRTDPRKRLALDLLALDPELLALRKGLNALGIEDNDIIEVALFSHQKVREIVSNIDRVPRDFNPFHLLKAPEKVRESYTYIVQKLLDTKIAKAILALDWSIDREDSADHSLGLREEGTVDLKDRLSEESPTFGKYHLYMDKGLGNGLRLRKIREKEVKDGKTPFICVGVGDSLFFKIHDVIMEGVKKEHHNNQHINRAIAVLSQMVQVKLREKWYTEESDYAIGKWKEKEDASFDLNDIYEVIQELSLRGESGNQIFDRESGNILGSQVFEGDDTRVIGIHEFYVLEVLFGGTRNSTVTHFSHRLSDIEAKIKIVEEKLNSYPDDFNFRKSRLKKVLKDFQQFQGELASIIQGASLGKGDNFLDKNGLGNINSPGDIFEDSFCKGIYNPKNEASQRDKPNLNERVKVNFHDFFRGYFTDIKKKLFTGHAERFKLITSTRSDSHEDERTFLLDIRNNMQMLAPSGVLLSDGINESFTGINRLEGLQQQVEKYNAGLKQNSEKCKLIILFDSKKQVIQSFAILKGRDDERILDGLLNDNIDIRKPIEVLDNISVYMEQELRKGIIGSDNKVHRLKGKHWAIPVAMKEILKRLGMKPDDTVEDNIIRESVENEIREFIEEQQDFFSYLEPFE